MGMGVKIFHRKAFHMGEQIIPQAPEGPLGHLYHYPVICPGKKRPYGVNGAYPNKRRRQRPKIRLPCANHGQDIDVNQGLHK